MNTSPCPSFAPIRGAQTPVDAIQVISFASANELQLSYLNQNLGLNLDTEQYRYFQQKFFHGEKKNPTFGELRLLGRLVENTPYARRIFPNELFTDSTVLMDTWADVMAGWHELDPYSDAPCTPADVLELPRKYLLRRGYAAPTPSRLSLAEGDPSAISQGYRPLLDVIDADGHNLNRIWQRTPRPVNFNTLDLEKSRYNTTPHMGDVILLIPSAPIEAVSVFMDEHPMASAVIASAATADGCLLGSTLSLCGGYGITLYLDTFLPPASSPTESRVQLYLDTYEVPCTMGLCHTVLRVSPAAADGVAEALSRAGLPVLRFGFVMKQPRVVMIDHGLVLVSLSDDLIRHAAAPRMYRYVLPVPAPICASETAERVTHRLAAPPLWNEDTDMSVASHTVHITEDTSDGYTPAIDGVLFLLGQMAVSGICYKQTHLSVHLELQGAPDAPVLLSAVCGLYRAAVELALPIEAPRIIMSPAKEGDSHLHITLMAYAYGQKPRNSAPTLTSPEHRLTLMSLSPDPAWRDIRGLLTQVAELASGTHGVGCHGIWFTAAGHETTLDLLSRISSPDTGAGLFDEHRELLSTPLPLAFLAETGEPVTGLPIGLTQHRAGSEIHREARRETSPLSARLISLPTLDQMIQTESIRRKEQAAMEKIKAFESLATHPRKVILDTDIGPDCDDVGAIVTLIHYAKQMNFPIIGICNCTSNKAGTGTIDAVCRRCGMETPPLGQWSKPDFMDDPACHKYNDAVAEAFSEDYRKGTLKVEDEVTFYRKRLVEAEDGEVMIISIGMFNNLAALLDSPADDISPLSGRELVRAKVYALVSMAAILPEGRECNVVSDYPAAQTVFDHWPTPMYLSDFHIGVNVKTGYPEITNPEDIKADPLVLSYHLYTKGWEKPGENASYDLTAVQFAALGVGDLYGLDTPGRLEFYAAIPDRPDLPDATRFIPDPMGNKIFMTKKVSDEVIAEILNRIIHMA